MPDRPLPRIAIATGDPAGIGPEVSLKAALDPGVRAICRPLVVGDPAAIRRHAEASGIATPLHVMSDIGEARWRDGTIEVLAVPFAGSADLRLGVNDAAYGRATLASAARAIAAARAGEVDAVVAAPHNQTSIAAAGIAFDGYPSFVARETGMNHHDVFLMLCFGEMRIVHCTLHVGVAQAHTLITRERVGQTIRAADAALRRIGIAAPGLCGSGLNPHAGGGGGLGREEVDAFVVMLHDQGHIAAKLLAFNQSAAFAIGSPILFSSVAHGSAFDIAGRGLANPSAVIEAITRLAGGNLVAA